MVRHLRQLYPHLFVGILLFGAFPFQANRRIQPVLLQIKMIVAVVIPFVRCIGIYRQPLLQVLFDQPTK